MEAVDKPQVFSNLVDLAAAKMGGEALLCSDDFFAEMENLLKEGRGVFVPERYTERGKWMDGWESRRRRTPGHDWCVIKLGVPGRICGFDIDTNHFLGNHAPFASIDGCYVEGDLSPEDFRDRVDWDEILAPSALERGCQNIFVSQKQKRCTHIRIHIYPDGGVARLRVYGTPSRRESEAKSIDLASVLEGAQSVACSDMFFSPMINLISPGRAQNMGEGWETRRRRGKGEDWIIIRLAQPGKIDKVDIDTHFFKGNYPAGCRLEGLYWPNAPAHMLAQWDDWHSISTDQALQADHSHILTTPDQPGPYSHIRLSIWPCGGVSRLRVWGQKAQAQPTSGQIQRFNSMNEQTAGGLLARCCGSSRWVQSMLHSRPFRSHEELLGRAEHVWWKLGDKDWLEAFKHHPRIGADIEQLRKKFKATADLSTKEQNGIVGASDKTLKALSAANLKYEEKYGFIFIVCATGKSAEEMLSLLQSRMTYEDEAELRIAAGEQLKITKIRLTTMEDNP
jgi:allantoicase